MIRGFACGVFDLYHPGHVLMLRECRQHCDHLTIAINKATQFDSHINPGKRAPFFNTDERRLILESIRYVDETLLYETEEELTEIMRSGNFDVRFLGDDYKGRPITAEDAITRIHFIDRSHGYSTSMYVQRFSERLKPAKE
jgi:glycerol-3-phosphate cytidylyltransferase